MKLSKIVLLVLFSFFSTLLFSQQGMVCGPNGCPSDWIDMSKMLQYKEVVPDHKINDRFGKCFDMKKYKNSPMLISVGVSRENLFKHDENLKTILNKYIEKGLKLVYVSARAPDKKEINKFNELDVYFDKDSLPIMNALKINRHYSVIILTKNHETILSSCHTVSYENLLRILESKSSIIF